MTPIVPIPDADVEDRETCVQRREARRHSRVPLVPYSGDAEEQQECAHYLEYFRRRHLLERHIMEGVF